MYVDSEVVVNGEAQNCGVSCYLYGWKVGGCGGEVKVFGSIGFYIEIGCGSLIRVCFDEPFLLPGC